MRTRSDRNWVDATPWVCLAGFLLLTKWCW